MAIGALLTGIHARSENLIQATQDCSRGRITEKDLRIAFKNDIKKIVRLQTDNDFTHLTDGMLTFAWNDLLRPFTENLGGVELGSLRRWFDTNTFYRVPKVKSKIQYRGDILTTAVEREFLPKGKPIRIVVPGPYTFAQLSDYADAYRDPADLMYDFASVLNNECKGLRGKGYASVQLSEPSLTCRLRNKTLTKDEKCQVGDAIQVATDAVDMDTCLHTCFGTFESLLPEALDYHVDCLGIDFQFTPLDALKDYRLEKAVTAGIVDSRSALVETAEELTARVDEICRISSQIYLCPNSGLEYRPEKVAEAKMNSIGLALNNLRKNGNA